MATAREIDKLFLEVLIAPDFEAEALTILEVCDDSFAQGADRADVGVPFSYISRALVPTAIISPVRLSKATTEGSIKTILSSLMIMVLAVPRSIASSCLKETSPCLSISRSYS